MFNDLMFALAKRASRIQTEQAEDGGVNRSGHLFTLLVSFGDHLLSFMENLADAV
jgi:hypothetical protein